MKPLPTTLSNDVWRLAKSKAFEPNVPDFSPLEGEVAPFCHSNFGLETTGQQLEKIPMTGEQSGVRSELKGSSLYLAKTG